jgi:hypothetical protein
MVKSVISKYILIFINMIKQNKKELYHRFYKLV